MQTKYGYFLLIFLLLCQSCGYEKTAEHMPPIEAFPAEPTAYDEFGGGISKDFEIDHSQQATHNTEEYDRINENEFLDATTNPLSTFSIDVDTASYSNVRRMLNESRLPIKDAVRIEELVNYFDYDYPEPDTQHPFSITTELSTCPWNAKHQLVHIGLQGKSIDKTAIPQNNLVFLLDVSGSMNSPEKLPLLKQAFALLLNELTEKDRVAIVVYAGAAGVVLRSTSGDQKEKILDALNKLEAGGSTAGSEGIALAYQLAKENFISNGNNRVILATDGDFNVGPSSDAELVRLIEEKRNDGIYLTILGFGMGNYKDSKMEQLSNAGNGNYAYIDTIREANKVLVHDLTGTLFTIAKDVKIQVEFNPTHVKGYRLIGYENRKLAAEDFTDDKKDAGELGAGHSVTALYEIIPANSDEPVKRHADLKYQNKVTPSNQHNDELMTVKLRYKKPDAENSIEFEKLVSKQAIDSNATSENFQFSAAVAEFGLLLRDSPFKAEANYNQVFELAKKARGADKFGYRQEFIQLVDSASLLSKKK